MTKYASRKPPANNTRRRRASPARDRILATAAKLFYARGVHAVGIDEIIDRSGVAKMSLYNNFDSKDALIVAYLRARHDAWMAWLHSAVESRGGPARRRLLAVFDALSEWCGSKDFRGCAFINTAAELCDPKHPARAVCREHKESLRAYLEQLAATAELERPDKVAGQLLILVEGAIVTSLLAGNAVAVGHAREAARILIGEAS